MDGATAWIWNVKHVVLIILSNVYSFFHSFSFVLSFLWFEQELASFKDLRMLYRFYRKRGRCLHSLLLKIRPRLTIFQPQQRILNLRFLFVASREKGKLSKAISGIVVCLPLWRHYVPLLPLGVRAGNLSLSRLHTQVSLCPCSCLALWDNFHVYFVLSFSSILSASCKAHASLKKYFTWLVLNMQLSGDAHWGEYVHRLCLGLLWWGMIHVADLEMSLIL